MRRSVMILAGVGVVIFGGVLTALFYATGWKAGLKQALASALIKQVPVPAAFGGEPSSTQGSVIYVMGGAGYSLRVRFATAAELYKQGLTRKVLIKSDNTLMGYSPSLGRNPSHDEWARGLLAGYGVKDDDIEVVAIEDGLLGTFQEAKTLSNVVSRRGLKSLVLVSSDYHTARVWYIFSKRMRREKVNLYIYPAREDHSGYGLLHEFVKFACYRIFL